MGAVASLSHPIGALHRRYFHIRNFAGPAKYPPEKADQFTLASRDVVIYVRITLCNNRIQFCAYIHG